MQDIWQLQEQTPGSVVVVPINLQWDREGLAIMGKGLALDAACRFPRLKNELGMTLQCDGEATTAAYWRSYEIITFPTKPLWREPAKLWLIERSARELLMITKAAAHGFSALHPLSKILMPKVGCGTQTGQLDWKLVRPALERILYPLADRITWVE